MDPAGELTELAQGGMNLGVGLVQQRPGLRVVVHARPQQAEADPDPEQPLLGTVVEIALEAPPLLVPGTGDARTGVAELRELRPQLGVEALVLEREPRGGARGLEERWLVQQDGSWIITAR